MHPDVAAVAGVLHAFDGDIVDVRPRGDVGRSFPDDINSYRRTTAALECCAVCDAGTCARYGGLALCAACAWPRWRGVADRNVAGVDVMTAGTDRDLTLEAIPVRHWRIVLLGELRKMPVTDTWQITDDLATIGRHLEADSNIGLVAGEASGVVIVDNDKPDLFRAMEAALGPLGRPWVRTGSGKDHRYLAWEPGLPAVLMWQGQRVGEIKRGGTLAAPVHEQAVMPPSLHPDGPAYEWLVDPRTEPLIALPEAWRRHLMGRIPVTPPSFTVPTQIHDGTRNETLYKLVRSLKAKGLSLAAVSAAVDAENLNRCVPPLPADELLALLEHAWTQPDRPGFAASRNGDEPHEQSHHADGPPASAASASIEVIDAADLVRREFTDEPALVGGGLIVPKALVVNGGQPKRGKSLLVLNREIRRARGRPFLGFATTPGRTLYIQAEIPEPQLKQRVVTMLANDPDAGSLDPEMLRGRLLTVTHRGLFIDEAAGYDAFRRLIEQTEPDLVSIDPLARFMTGEENSARDIGRLINSLDRLIQEYRVAIELTHHAGKPSKGDPRQGGQRLRGSSALFGAADSVTILDRTQDAWTLSFELRHAEEPAPMLLDRTPAMWFTTSGPPEKLVAVALLVKDIPMKYTTLSGAIVSDTKCSTPTAERLIRDAKRAGLIWQGDDGRYRQTIKQHHGDDDGERSAE
jgi:AAA domain/Bifunctional DNA primase/polymerase, N-terminal